jgi:polyribonucleotide 5'-hydroxyl-kinase
LTEGQGEIFGTELAPNQTYRFQGRKAAVFTWTGCKIETTGSNVVEYVGHETSMETNLNIHVALENLREEAERNDAVGPRVMIVGPGDVGKTSMAKTLLGYGARNGNSVVLVDIDPEEVILNTYAGSTVTAW